MLDLMESLVARLVRLPPVPVAPAGSGDSALVFRASRRFYHLRLARWGMKQLGAAIGITMAVLWVWIPNAVMAAKYVHFGPWTLTEILTSRWFVAIEVWGVAVFLLQMPLTLAMVRLDYRQRWYLVTDRSLRIREGVRSIREQTMTYANIQNLVIRQDPIQRLLGISDLHVRTAGGGDKQNEHGGTGSEDEKGHALHLAIFRGVDNAQEIRDLIFERLKGIRTAGLGDPDEQRPEVPSSAAAAVPASIDLSDIIVEVREEAAMLRAAVRGSVD